LALEARGAVDASGVVTTGPPTYGASVTAYTYDALGTLSAKGVGCPPVTTATVADCTTTQYSYSPRGDLLSVTRPAGESYAYSYDGLHRLTSVTPPLENLACGLCHQNGLCNHRRWLNLLICRYSFALKINRTCILSCNYLGVSDESQ
jgi:YD repeat-containing protein